MSVFEAATYKDFLKAWISARPKGGRGESRRLAERLGLSSTLVSQVLGGDKDFTMEAANDLCEYLGLSDREADHFLLLVDHSRAGSHGLRKRLERKIKEGRENARRLSENIEKDRELSEKENAVFYSHWLYAGITNFLPTQPEVTVEALAERFKMPAAVVARVISFLLETGIITHQAGRYEPGFVHMHVGADSPFVIRHHQNWRIRGFERMPYSKDNDLFFTSPMSLSKEDADLVRADLLSFVQKTLRERVGPSPSEVVRCLSIDWFEY